METSSFRRDRPPGSSSLPSWPVNSTVSLPIVKPNGFSAAWSGDPGFDLHPLMQWTSRLHAWMGTFFQTGGDPPYRVFLRFNPANAGGGVAFPNSFVVTYGDGVTAESLKHILPHEMVHTWTANDLGKWYDEGDAVYYQALLPWRAGMISTEAYLDDINKTAARYYTNPELNTPEKRIIPNFWTDTWLNTLAYDRGALYFAVLDGKIRRASGNKRSVDDLVRAMIRKARAGDRITEATWIELLRREIGKEGVRVHDSMMQGGLVVPESERLWSLLSPRDQADPPLRARLQAHSLPDGKKRVEGLVDGSEAEKARLKERRRRELSDHHDRGRAARSDGYRHGDGDARRQNLSHHVPAARQSGGRVPVGARFRRVPDGRVPRLSFAAVGIRSAGLTASRV